MLVWAFTITWLGIVILTVSVASWSSS